MTSQTSQSDRPRNRRAVARGARNRETIRQMMLQHATEHPLSRPLTGKELQRLLRDRGIHLGLSAILWHVQHVRLQADLEALDVELRRNQSDSTPPPAGL